MSRLILFSPKPYNLHTFVACTFLRPHAHYFDCTRSGLSTSLVIVTKVSNNNLTAVTSFLCLLRFQAMEQTGGLHAVKRRRMANYGLKTYTHEQIKEQWRESMKVDNNLVV